MCVYVYTYWYIHILVAVMESRTVDMSCLYMFNNICNGHTETSLADFFSVSKEDNKVLYSSVKHLECEL